MPHRKKRSFIDKKNAVTFHLVHRSQKDPLAADERAPQHVLLPVATVELEKRKEEERKFGVFFDDDYDYLQHLKEANKTSELLPTCPDRAPSSSSPDEEEKLVPASAASINLPSSVFASEFEEEVGLLNKAAPVSGPRLDLDPDIVAALDEDFDFDDPENILDDDFIIKANDITGHVVGDGDDEEDDDGWCTDEEDQEDGDYESSGALSEGEELREFLFADCETKSRFTEYSLTSSVMRRNEQLTLLDQRFEKFYEQFDEDEIGALDNTELEGHIQPDSVRLEDVIRHYYIQKEKDYQTPDQLGPAALASVREEESEEEEEEEEMVVKEPVERWDCESIISTYSNLYNRPKLIQDPPKHKPIRVSSKTGVPLDVLPACGPTARQLERMERINDSDLPRAANRPRGREETTAERRERKQAVKEERKVRRVEKKTNKLAFKQEKQLQEKQIIGLKANVHGLKL